MIVARREVSSAPPAGGPRSAADSSRDVRRDGLRLSCPCRDGVGGHRGLPGDRRRGHPGFRPDRRVGVSPSPRSPALSRSAASAASLEHLARAVPPGRSPCTAASRSRRRTRSSGPASTVSKVANRGCRSTNVPTVSTSPTSSRIARPVRSRPVTALGHSSGQPVGADQGDPDQDERHHDPEHNEGGEGADVRDHPLEVHPEESCAHRQWEEHDRGQREPFVDHRRLSAESISEQRVELRRGRATRLKNASRTAQHTPRAIRNLVGQWLVRRQDLLVCLP